MGRKKDFSISSRFPGIHQKNEDAFAIVMAGGKGTRLYPVSTPDRPKQFLDLLGTGETLLQMTIRRLLPLFSESQIIVVVPEQYVDLTREQIPGSIEILPEPYPNNTLSALIFASWYLAKRYGPEIVSVALPSDNWIGREEEWRARLQTGIQIARERARMVVLGIVPERPDPGYGYIQRREAENDACPPGVYDVRAFVEKPPVELAKQFVESGDFYWNAGIFIWKQRLFHEQIQILYPEIFEACNRVDFSVSIEQISEQMREVYSITPRISIDYAVMEKSPSLLCMVECPGPWSDLGNWEGVVEILRRMNSPILQEVSCVVPGCGGRVFVLDYRQNRETPLPKLEVIMREGIEDQFLIWTEKQCLWVSRGCSSQVRILGEQAHQSPEFQKNR